jgi:hypothetical protein
MANFGLESRISVMAYDTTAGLLAIGKCGIGKTETELTSYFLFGQLSMTAAHKRLTCGYSEEVSHQHCRCPTSIPSSTYNSRLAAHC